MSKEKFFEGESGVYFIPNRNKLVLMAQVESYGIYNKETNTYSTVKRYNLDYGNTKVNKVAVKRNDDLLFLGQL